MVSTILLTEPRCNFKCQYCYYSHENNLRNKGFNREATIENIQKDIEKYENKKDKLWFLLWGGEPTINRYFKEVVLMIREQSQSVGIFTSTNGSALTDDFIEFCKENRVRMAVSHDLIYQDARKEGTSLFDTKYAEQVAKAIKENVVDEIQTVWSEDSWDIQAMYKYLKKFFKKYKLKPVHWKLNPFTAFSEEDKDKTIHSKRALNSYKKWMVDTLTGTIKNPPEPEPGSRKEFNLFLDIASGYDTLEWNDILYQTQTNENNPTCQAYDLNSQLWNCKDTYMQNNCEHPFDVKHQYDLCFKIKCPYFKLCKGICSGKTDKFRLLQCDSIKVILNTNILAFKEVFIDKAKQECEKPEINIVRYNDKTHVVIDGKGNFLDFYFCARNSIEEIYKEEIPVELGHSFEKYIEMELEDKYIQVIARAHNYKERKKPSDLILGQNF